MNRTMAWMATALLVVVLIAPALMRPPADGFPLSTYPMFASDRGAQSAVSTAVGYTRSGERVRLSPYLLAGAAEPILAVRTAGDAIRSGRADPWCVEVADRVESAATPADDDPVVRVEVVTETHDSVATVTRSAAPIRVDVHATCPIPRPVGAESPPNRRQVPAESPPNRRQVPTESPRMVGAESPPNRRRG